MASKKSTKNTVNARLESLEKAVLGLTAVVTELVKLHQTEVKPTPKAKAGPKPKAKAKPKAEPKAKAKPQAKAEPKPTVVIEAKYQGLAGWRLASKECKEAGLDSKGTTVELLARLAEHKAKTGQPTTKKGGNGKGKKKGK